MFAGATRRLVANLSVEDCLQKRKSALAEELLREVSPVVGGEGKLDDYTTKGWGIVIDTIEIQEVRVLSESVFAAMQAPYRAALELGARQAKAQAAGDGDERPTCRARSKRPASRASSRERRDELERAGARPGRPRSARGRRRPRDRGSEARWPRGCANSRGYRCREAGARTRTPFAEERSVVVPVPELEAHELRVWPWPSAASSARSR
jgi:hypothetical protein